MKEENTASKKKIVYYVIAGVCALLLITATILTVYFVTDGAATVEAPPVDQTEPGEPSGPSQPQEPDDPGPQIPDEPDDSKPSAGEDTVKFVKPVDYESFAVEYAGIYENKTLGWWYRHKAVDFAVSAGTDVQAMADGKVETISLSAETGNYIVIDHGDGLKTLYRFIEPVSSLKEGDAVSKGQKIGTVAQAYGSEAFQGEHLHLEVFMGKDNVDPTDYLEPELEEK